MTVQQTAKAPITAESLLTRYADDLAFVTEDEPATTLAEFSDQLRTAEDMLVSAGIHIAEGLSTAATLLDQASDGSPEEQAMFLARARKHLVYLGDAVDEYRDMV